MSLSSYAEESAPLTTELSSSSNDVVPPASRDTTKNTVKDRRRRSNNNFFSSFTQKKQPSQTNVNHNNDNIDSGSDNSDIEGCTDYQHANPLRAGKYQGYCTLDGGGRVSLLDDWDFSPRNSAVSNNDSDDYDEDDGQFVSYWGQSSDDNDDDDSVNNNDPKIDDRIETTMRPIPLRYRQYQGGMSHSFSTNRDVSNNASIGNDRNKRGEGILSLPIIRPFLRRSHQGFSDHANEFNNSNDEVGDDDNDDNAPSREDRAAVMKSISDGIVGTQSNDPILLNSVDNSKDQQRTPPNLLNRIFLTRFIQVPHRNEEALLRQLHDLLRKEDWSLATELLESKPMLARKWHSVKRLYGGKFDAEVLPIHSACALCPPASFIQALAAIYPEGLLMKEKAFGRIPLHIACRSLADSSVIKVLCDMEPRSVIERDSLKRAALHYLIKNYNAFGQDDGEDDEDTEDDYFNQSTTNPNDNDKAADGIVALNLLVETDIDCVKVADHRGWIPLHVACSCSARQGMIRVMKMLIDWWPESVDVKTEKNSDVFAIVEMAGKHHATKDKVVALLKEARRACGTVEGNEENEDDSSASEQLAQTRCQRGQDTDADAAVLANTEEAEKEVASDSVDKT
eukprot:scaffold4137_cov126-Skeletonema_dohrnii-CCMP3373.AAC.2